MRYGLCLLVTLALSVCANAQTPCNGTSCKNPSAFDGVVVKGVVHTAAAVVTAPVRILTGGCSSCGQASASAAPACSSGRVGPIRAIVRCVFRR